MAGLAGGDSVDSESQEGWHEYSPSWVDRFTAWVEWLPGPNWSYYSGKGLLLFFEAEGG
jgi:hypothetical protein